MHPSGAAIIVRVCLGACVATSWAAGGLATLMLLNIVAVAQLTRTEQLWIVAGGLTVVAIRALPATLLAVIALLNLRRFQSEEPGASALIIAGCTLAAPISSAIGAIVTLPFVCAFVVLEFPIHVMQLALGVAACASVLRVSAARTSEATG